MTHFLTCYLQCQDKKKVEKLKIYILNVYCLDLSFALTDNSENKKPLPNMLTEYKVEPKNYMYMIQLIPECSTLDLLTVTTHF